MWLAPPPELRAEPFACLPDSLRRTGVRTAWGDANKGGPVDCFLEGPAFDAEGRLWCVDIPHGRLFTVDADGRFETMLEYDGEPNGLKHGPDGRIWLADYRNGIMAFDPATGRIEPVLERRRAERFKGPNDLTFAQDGTLYFTDQGQTGMHDPTGRVYRLTPDGRLDCLIDNAPSPNGLVLEAGDAALHVAMTRSNQIWRVPLPREGGTAKVQVFVNLFGGLSGPDGLAMDVEGNLAIAHAGLGMVFQVDRLGQPRRLIRSGAGLTTTNLAYGGEDNRDLYITESATGTILRTRLDVPGKTLPQWPGR